MSPCLVQTTLARSVRCRLDHWLLFVYIIIDSDHHHIIGDQQSTGFYKHSQLWERINHNSSSLSLPVSVHHLRLLCFHWLSRHFYNWCTYRKLMAAGVKEFAWQWFLQNTRKGDSVIPASFKRQSFGRKLWQIICVFLVVAHIRVVALIGNYHESRQHVHNNGQDVVRLINYFDAIL